MTKFSNGQEEAINHIEKPMLVVAGPGAGKTTVIINRVKKLIDEGVSPNRILVITFTKSAAKEMNIRFNDNFFIENGKVIFSTFHSIFYKILKQSFKISQDSIILEDKKITIIEQLIKEKNISLENGEDKIKKIISEIGCCKNLLCNPKDYDTRFVPKGEFLEVIEMYDKYKKQNNQLDFDDMAQLCYNTFIRKSEILDYWKNQFDYILIDEFQDINTAQYECIKLLNRTDNIFVVGDDDQSIYKFRGSKPEFLKFFIEDFKDTKKIVLDTNYRSTDEIIKLTNSIINNNANRISKMIKGTKKRGEKPVVIESDDITSEANKIANKVFEQNKRGIHYNEMAVIYRTNIQARAFVEIFTNLNIPYVLKDLMPSLMDSFLTKDIFAYFKLTKDLNDRDSAIRIINKPKRYISKRLVNEFSKEGNLFYNIVYQSGLEKWQLAKLEELLQDINVLKNLTSYEAIYYIRRSMGYDEHIKELAEYRGVGVEKYFEILNELQEKSKQFSDFDSFYKGLEDEQANILKACEEERKNKEIIREGVTLTTLHSSKGLEFKTVFIVGAVNGIIPLEQSQYKNEIEEERRLFYVGLTRAKENLFISYSKTRYESEYELTKFLKIKK